MCVNNRSDGRASDEFSVYHLDDDTKYSTAAHIHLSISSDTAYRFGDGVSLGPEIQLVRVNLVRHGSSPALTRHTLVGMMPTTSFLAPRIPSCLPRTTIYPPGLL